MPGCGHSRLARFETGNTLPSGSSSRPLPRARSASSWSRTRAIAARDGGFSAAPRSRPRRPRDRRRSASPRRPTRRRPRSAAADIVADAEEDRRAQDPFVGDARRTAPPRPAPGASSAASRWSPARSSNGQFGVSQRRQQARDAVQLVVGEAAADVARRSAAGRPAPARRAAARRSAGARRAARCSRRSRTSRA